MSDIQAELAYLRQRVDALEAETMAYSALFTGLMLTLGPQYLDTAARVAELTEAHAQGGSSVGKRMTEALRIIDQLRTGGDSKPKPGSIV